jgi:hypothetical protein
MALVWAVDPSPLSVPLGQSPEPVAAAEPVFVAEVVVAPPALEPELELDLLLLLQADRSRALVTVRATAVEANRAPGLKFTE